MYVKINKWLLSILTIGAIAFGALPTPSSLKVVAAEPVLSEEQGVPIESTTGTVDQEKPPVNVENKAQEKAKETVEYEKRVWPADSKGLRVKQESAIASTDFLSLAPLAQSNINKIEWGNGVPSTSKSGEYTTTLLLTMKDGKQILYQDVPYLVYSYKEETLINGLSYDKQARKLTGKTEPKVQVTAEAQFTKNPSDVEITATESDENGVFAFVYEKEPLIISLTVDKDPYVQYATTKYEIETNQVEMNDGEQTSPTSDTAHQTTSSSEPAIAPPKKKAENLPQTGELQAGKLEIIGGLYVCVILGIIWIRIKQEKIES